jgi:Ycf66 protein N-terminus
MLAYILAVLVGSGSVSLYLAAFFYPEIHRKQDFIWSGVGCFYALFLWVYAHQVTGGILVGQTTSVILLGWFAWQTFQLRRQLAPIDREAAIANAVQLPNRKGTTKSASPKPTSPTSATIPSATTVSTAPATKVQQSIEKPTAPVATKPAANEKPTAPVATKPAANEKPTAPVATKPAANEEPTAPVATKPAANEKPTAPIATKPAANEKPTTPIATKPAANERSTMPVDTTKQSIDRPAPDSISLADVKIPPATIKATPPIADRQVASSPQPLPPTTPSPEAEEDRAWIKLEVKPNSARSKPLGTPAQPPTPLLAAATNPEEIAKSTQSRPQTDSNSNIQSDSISTAKIELEEPN